MPVSAVFDRASTRVSALQQSPAYRYYERYGDLAFAVILAVAAFIYGSQVYLEHVTTAQFYQHYMLPALHFACTGNFSSFVPDANAMAFLNQQTDHLANCSSVAAAPAAPWTVFDVGRIYFLGLTGIVWRVLGITWANLYVIAGGLTALLAVSAYAFLRVFVSSRIVSALTATWFISSFVVGYYIPELRDFSKAPFIVLPLVFIAIYTTKQQSTKTRLLTAFIAGAAIGLGSGFRYDSNVVLVVGALCALLTFNIKTPARSIISVVAIWLCLFVGYELSRLPIMLVEIASADTAKNIYHVIILGFAELFYNQLHMGNVGYSALQEYNDISVLNLANIFENGSVISNIDMSMTRYDDVTAVYLRDLVGTFPLDVLMRAVAGVIEAPRVGPFAWAWSAVALLLYGVAMMVRPKVVIFLLAVAVMFGVIATLQFDNRHVFYVGLFSITLLWASIEILFGAGRRRLAEGHGLQLRLGAAQIASLSAVSIAVLAVAAVAVAAEKVQSTSIRQLADVYEHLDWRPIEFATSVDGAQPRGPLRLEDGSIFDVSTIELGGAHQGESAAFLARVRFAGAAAPAPAEPMAWQAAQGGDLRRDGNGFATDVHQRGYAVESRQFSVPSLLTTSAAPGSSLVLHVEGTAEGAFSFGVLNSGRDRWLAGQVLPIGPFRVSLEVPVPPGEDELSVMFEKLTPGAAELKVTAASFAVHSLDRCNFEDLSVRPEFQYIGSITTGYPIGGVPDGDFSFYFPMTFTQNLAFERLKMFPGTANCIVDWSVAAAFPKHTLPVAMFVRDGEPVATRRGDWGTLWRAFAR